MSNSSLRSFEMMMHELVEEFNKKETNNVNSGYRCIDDLISGFKPGELIIITMCSGRWKASLNIAEFEVYKYVFYMYL